MNIGFLGLGKLGLPVALAVESKGHQVAGYDVDDKIRGYIESRQIPYREEGIKDHFKETKLQFSNVEEIVRSSDIIFIPIQTPHGPHFEGITRLPSERADFDYSYLKSGVRTLSEEIEKQRKNKIVVIASTVLPGTIGREIKPLLGEHTKLCYNPFFIAMGTTIRDFLSPEFILFGVDDQEAAHTAEKFYRTITDAPFYKTTIENAELIKVLYNTFLSTKVAFANTVMEMCHKIPNTNVDNVTNALKMANSRLISGKYLSGGMGDGGGCHPRDNIALSWLSRKLDLSHDWFENVMLQREKQTEWLADLIEQQAEQRPIIILGKAYKPETNLTIGSASILLKTILEERGRSVTMWDPHSDESSDFVDEPTLYFIGTKHQEFQRFRYSKGSVILDPWRYIGREKDDIKVIWIGDQLLDI
jgi:UDPglucose 6-dehydrogenase